jgi:hypothetical protein
MPVVYGREKIRRIIEERLEREKQNLGKTIAAKEGKFLFVTLETMNYLFGSSLIGKKIGEWSSYKLEVHKVIVCLKEILDVILTNGFRNIEAPSEIEFTNMLEYLRDHFAIAKHSHLLQVQQKYGEESAMVKEDRVEDLRDKEFYEAIRHWVDNAGSDPDWVNFYYSNYPEHRIETGNLIEKEFTQRYDLELRDLTNIDAYFQHVCENHLKTIKETQFPKGYPFLYIKKKKLFRDFSQHMSKATTNRWLKLLEYKIGEDLVKYPLIPLKLHGKKIYALVHWVFVPSNAFWGAWVSDLLLEMRGSRAYGKWSSGYGMIFEKYIDAKLGRSSFEIKNLGKRKIDATKYPEALRHFSDLRKTSFEIDRIFLKGDFCFVASCKAHDFLYDRKIQTRDFFFPTKEIEKKVDQNLKDMNEIYINTKFIASSQRILSDIRAHCTTLVPIVLTSRVEPMSVEEVRAYYRRSLQFHNVPTLTIQHFFKLLPNLSNLIAGKKLEFFQKKVF